MQLTHYFLLIFYFIDTIRSVPSNTQNGYYIVIAPGTLYSEHAYTVSVVTYNTQVPCKVNVSLTGPSLDSFVIVNLQKDNNIKLAQFDLPKLRKGTYSLTVRGLSGLIFENTTRLIYKKFHGYTRIQTAKGLYRPGETVQFRVFFLNENLQPVTPKKNATIWIEDAQHNRLKEFRSLTVQSGVFVNELSIASNPVLGRWRICVHNGPKILDECVYFSVQEYVVSEFNVQILAPERIALSEGVLSVVVRANDASGKPIEGRVSLSVEEYIEAKTPPVRINEATVHTATVTRGKAKFNLILQDYFGSDHKVDSIKHLSLKATVEERYTLEKLNSSWDVALHRYRYHITCQSSKAACLHFVGGETHTLRYKVIDLDGEPVRVDNETLQLIYVPDLRRIHNDNKKTTPNMPNKRYVFKALVDYKGTAVFQIKLPDLPTFSNYMSFYRSEFIFNGEHQKENRMKRAAKKTSQVKKRNPYDILIAIEGDDDDDNSSSDSVSDSDSASIEDTQLEDGKSQFVLRPKGDITNIIFRAPMNSTVYFSYAPPTPTDHITYTIVSRGNVILTRHTQARNSQNKFDIKVHTNFLMTPISQLLIQSVDHLGNLEFAEYSFYVKLKYKNFLEIRAPNLVNPGETVNFNIKTTPNSYVGLLAVDKRALMQRRNNDLTHNDMKWLLTLFKTYTPWQGGFSRYPGEKSGLVTLTNAKYNYVHKSQFWKTPKNSKAKKVKKRKRKSNKSNNFKKELNNNLKVPNNVIESIRENFPEVWIFEDFNNTSSSGTFHWSRRIPDTITKWELTAFSIHPELGISLLADKINISSEKPLYMTLRLPYAVKTGEAIQLPLLVHNNLNKSLDVTVTLSNTAHQFEYIVKNNKLASDEQLQKTVNTSAMDYSVVEFIIKPTIFGKIKLKFTAKSPLAQDILVKELKVLASGVVKRENQAVYVTLNNTQSARDKFQLKLPESYVNGTQHVELTVMGDILGPVLDSSDELQNPLGGTCEHDTTKIVSNYLMLDYLTVTNKLKKKWRKRLLRNIELSYQNVLKYQNSDGSFSFFYPTTKNRGSTWLTAYVIRSLENLRKYFTFNERILTAGYKYLLSKQSAIGSFVETGDTPYYNKLSPVEVTAYVLLTLLADDRGGTVKNMYKALEYIKSNMRYDGRASQHSKALINYALEHFSHPKLSVPAELNNLEVCHQPDECLVTDLESFKQTSIAAYTALYLFENDAYASNSSLALIRKLMTERNRIGGAVSTYDTALNLQAIFEFAKRVKYLAAEVQVDVVAKTSKGISQISTININASNAQEQQTVILPASTQVVEYMLKGKGGVLLQISYRYNTIEKPPEKPGTTSSLFEITANIEKSSLPHKLKMLICATPTTSTAYGISVLELFLPSGYYVNGETIKTLNSNEGVQSVSAKEKNTVLIVYLTIKSMDIPRCINVTANKGYIVDLQQPASLVVYDYINPTQRSTHFYNI